MADSASHDRITAAEHLAEKLDLPLVSTSGAEAFDLILAVCDRRLELRDMGVGGSGPVYVDFIGGVVGRGRFSTFSRRQPIASAFGLRPEAPDVDVIDATAGLARDTYLLAGYGCLVRAIERSPILGALVLDGLRRAAARGPQGMAATLGRITLLVDDSRQILANLNEPARPDVVYLDPMYPAKKKTALPKKELRICRKLVGDDPDAGELFDIARRTAKRRVVVKRHPLAPPLGPDPDLRFRGKLVRYDVYLVDR